MTQLIPMEDIVLVLSRNLLALVEILCLVKQKYILLFTSGFGIVWYDNVYTKGYTDRLLVYNCWDEVSQALFLHEEWHAGSCSKNT